MSKLTDLIIEQIEQGQNALKREHNIRREHHKITDPFAIMALEEHDRLVNEIAVEHGLHADDDRDDILSIIIEERSDNE